MGKIDSDTATATAAVDYAQEWLAVPEMLLDRARRVPDAVEQQFRALDEAHEYRPHSLVNVDALALLVVDPAAHTLLFSSGSLPPDPLRLIDWDMAATALRGRAMQLAHADREADHPLLAYIPGREAMNWGLPDDVRRALEGAPSSVLIATTSAASEKPLRRACAAFGMTGLETRVLEATLRTGSIRAGAAAANLGYATAREAISTALAKVGVTRMPGLLHHLSLLALGIFPNSDEATELLTDRWGLKPRQAQIALLLAQGMTRADVARAIGISEATVKKQTDIIFQTLGVASAAALARSISVVTAMQALAEASHGRIGWIDGNAAPLRFVHRPSGGRIALSDYGPVGGRPVVILHSSMTSRHPPRGLVAELMRHDFRVLAIDRPGFGMTDIDGEVAAGDPFEPAAHDMTIVLDRLRIDRVDIIARGGAQVAVAFAGLYPDRCGAVVLVNPDPPSTRDTRRWGVLGAFKEAYFQRPELILPAARLIARTMTRSFLAKALHKSMRGSPPDEALLADEEMIDDYYRAVRMFTTGRLSGYVREQTALARGTHHHYPVDGGGWSVLLGGHDTLSDPRTTLSYWQERIPAANFEILKDQGRLLAYAVPSLVVERLVNGKRSHFTRTAPTRAS